ncbi:3-phosphoserine/phosphohydroxythreonine transaminase [Peptoniphilus raoultii]|uniref:3-phosphoserine/phosphohydroxythreonine transaminase n=1 Tax=Peptoniphilus raoultii TaxID=1776387 RepID=UPI0008D942D5|nr:3-phosphoserine/phosphohydroxythreonine transaminase [Peptoniphilus raoultii]
MNRIYNFAAGPSQLPLDVLEEAKRDLLNYKGSGMSVMEMSHRSSSYKKIQEEVGERIKHLMGLGDDYDILFLQAGGSLQFYMVPLNFLKGDEVGSYLVTGSWAKKAYDEGTRFFNTQKLASSEDKNFSYIPEINLDNLDPRTKFLYLCTNNTIYGTRISPDLIPENLKPLLVADMSSNILSEVYDFNKFDLIFAGVQKNLGPAGVVIVLIRKGTLEDRNDLPTMLDYRTHISKDSIYNTPPCFNIYMCGLVAKYLEDNGGILEFQKKNEEKAKLLYDYIDNSKIFTNPVNKEDRSLMNVTFVTGSKDLDEKFVEGAKDRGLENLKGHRSVGGMRASIYNSMTIDGVKALINYMEDFEKEHKNGNL